jgi:hypothetical protein
MTCSTRIERWILEPERREEYEKWMNDLPEQVQVVVKNWPPYVPCYRMLDNPGHYKIVTYSEHEPNSEMPASLTLAHGRDSFLPGAGVLGVPPEQCVPCGCGAWENPTEEQTHDTLSTIVAEKISEAFGGDCDIEVRAMRVTADDLTALRRGRRGDDNGTVH